MRQTFEGLIVRQVRYGEQGCILSVLKSSGGLADFSVRLSLGQRKKFGALLQVMTPVQFESQSSKNGKLPYASNFQLISGLSPAMGAPLQAAVCLFMAEVIQKTTFGEDADAQLYQLAIKHVNHCLLHKVELYKVPLQFLADLLQWTGICPDTSTYQDGFAFGITQQRFFLAPKSTDLAFEMPPETARHFVQLLNHAEVPHSTTQRRMLLAAIIHYLEYHQCGQRSIKSHLILGNW